MLKNIAAFTLTLSLGFAASVHAAGNSGYAIGDRAPVSGGSYRNINGGTSYYNGGGRSSSSTSSSSSSGSGSSGWQYKRTMSGTPMRYQFSGGGAYRSQVLINGVWR